MVYNVSKIIDEVELLPDITETSIWKDYNHGYCSKGVNLIYNLYTAISKRENYYQRNSPTAYGDPKYSYYSGMVTGMLIASGCEELLVNDQIVIKKGNRKILVIDKVKRPQSYYDERKEINALMQGILG